MPTANGIRILIVDDQPRARKSLRALLSTWPRTGEIYEAGNGCEGVQLVSELQPDVVVMDIRMPRMDGLEAMREIKMAWPQVRVVLLSIYPEYRSEALAMGADAFLGKEEAPGRLLELLAALTQGGT